MSKFAFLFFSLGIALLLINCALNNKISVKEVREFLAEDDTDLQKQYYSDPHACFWFSYHLILTGKMKGLNFDLTSIVFRRHTEDNCSYQYYPHDIVSIDTKNGYIYIEPQDDRVVPLTKGSDYYAYLDLDKPAIVDYWETTPGEALIEAMKTYDSTKPESIIRLEQQLYTQNENCLIK